jgi:hypothetical protein
MSAGKHIRMSERTRDALKSASDATEAEWCLECGQIRLDDKELDAGDRMCPETLRAGTPSACIKALDTARAGG